MLAAMELAGDDEAVVLIVQQALGRRLEQPPVPLVDRDHRLAEVVDLVDAARAGRHWIARLRSPPTRRVVLRVEGQAAGSPRRRPCSSPRRTACRSVRDRRRPGRPAAAQGQTDGQRHRIIIPAMTRRRETMAASRGSSLPASTGADGGKERHSSQDNVPVAQILSSPPASAVRISPTHRTAGTHPPQGHHRSPENQREGRPEFPAKGPNSGFAGTGSRISTIDAITLDSHKATQENGEIQESRKNF